MSYLIIILIIINLNFIFMCPKNWILINSKCFLINKTPDTYMNNLLLCKRYGAFLLHDLNLNDIEHLSKFLDDKSAWIGHLTNLTFNQSNKFESNCIYLNKKDGILFNERCLNEHIQLCYKQSILDMDLESSNNELIINPIENLLTSNAKIIKRRGFSIRKKLFRFGKKNKKNYKLDMINQSMNKIESELHSLKKQLRQISKEKS